MMSKIFYVLKSNYIRAALLLLVPLYSSVSAASSPPVLLVVGDSLSAAYNLAPEQGWVFLLEQRLEQYLSQSKHVERYRVVNASAGGATSAAALQRLPALLSLHQPKIVVLEMGANDGLQGKPVSYITENLRQLIRLSQAAGAQVVLTGIQLPPNYGKRYTEPFFTQYAVLAEEYQLPLVPFLLEGVAGNNDLMQPDRLHPTAEAQPRVLDNVWPILKEVL